MPFFNFFRSEQLGILEIRVAIKLLTSSFKRVEWGLVSHSIYFSNLIPNGHIEEKTTEKVVKWSYSIKLWKNNYYRSDDKMQLYRQKFMSRIHKSNSSRYTRYISFENLSRNQLFCHSLMYLKWAFQIWSCPSFFRHGKCLALVLRLSGNKKNSYKCMLITTSLFIANPLKHLTSFQFAGQLVLSQ